jgi:hypothetical protein
VPRCSDRLAKKVVRRAPSVAATQNVVMHKLGLLSSEHVESSDFDHYLSSFNGGISLHQAQLIQELLSTTALLVVEEHMPDEVEC